MDLSQVRLITDDFRAMYLFYKDVIGLKPQFETETGPYVAFKPDLGSALSLHSRTELSAVIPDLQPHGGDNALISLRVDDLDAYLATLSVPTTSPVVLDDRIKVAYLRDPEGNLLELQQWLVTRSGAPVPPAQ
ncbi:VOC family protein [Actinocrispum sp. NPDC049592]|uniref:VOC family protein n=1 Tax=Actinocrispum sp. NPDC049592 TaxID=3154835 RepID=UPI0034157F3A